MPRFLWSSRSSGVTLVELLVVLVVLGILTEVSAAAVISIRVPDDSVRAMIRQARTNAITRQTPQAVQAGARSILFLPDGRAVGTGIDPFTGRVSP